MVVTKKSWTPFFNRIKKGHKRIEVRLLDFKPSRKPFPMVLEEWNPKTGKYTGRRLRVQAKILALADILSFYSVRDLLTKRLAVLEYSNVKEIEKKKSKKR